MWGLPFVLKWVRNISFLSKAVNILRAPLSQTFEQVSLAKFCDIGKSAFGIEVTLLCLQFVGLTRSYYANPEYWRLIRFLETAASLVLYPRNTGNYFYRARILGPGRVGIAAY